MKSNYIINVSTALLISFSAISYTQASHQNNGITFEGGDLLKKRNPLSVPLSVGVIIDSDTLPSNDQFTIHNASLNKIKDHFDVKEFSFENSKARFTFTKLDGEQNGILTSELKKGKNFSNSDDEIISGLSVELDIWFKSLGDFIKTYFPYRSNSRDVTLLQNVNERYKNRKVSSYRPEPLGEALDGVFIRVMSLILQQAEKDAKNSTPIIQADFQVGRDSLWQALAAATLSENDYDNTLESFVNGNSLRQLAFEAMHYKIILKNDLFLGLISDLSSHIHDLPYCKNDSYQSLMGAETILAMSMFQKYLVNTQGVETLFEMNKEALRTEQKIFIDSSIRKEDSRELLATDLLPLTDVDLIDNEANDWRWSIFS